MTHTVWLGKSLLKVHRLLVRNAEPSSCCRHHLAQCEVTSALFQSGLVLRLICVCRRSLEGFDKVKLLSMFASEDGSFLVVLYQFFHSIKAALTDTVNSIRQLHLEVLVLSGCLQRHREITRLERK